jgi:hypothetical protein
MKYLFASLLCHRDVEIFEFNWFCQRVHLNKGFDIRHLILSDGSLTSEDKEHLRRLPGVIIEEEPATIYDAPKAILLAKLECLKRGFENHGADRVIVFDADIFFLRSWEADLRKMLTERAVVLRDWGSSLGPNVAQYRKLYGVHEDASTPNCNTGVISIKKEDMWRIDKTLHTHLANPFQIMEDQGVVFAALYGNLSYANGIACVINNAEFNPQLWDWVVRQNAAHLMGMRTRGHGIRILMQEAIQNLPAEVPLKEITPASQEIGWGLLGFDTYNFKVPLQKVPSTCGGEFRTDSMYLHGGSRVTWKVAPYFGDFRCDKLVCADTGIPSSIPYVLVNGQRFHLNDKISVSLKGSLTIQVPHGSGSHAVFICPRLTVALAGTEIATVLSKQAENTAHMA